MLVVRNLSTSLAFCKSLAFICLSSILVLQTSKCILYLSMSSAGPKICQTDRSWGIRTRIYSIPMTMSSLHLVGGLPEQRLAIRGRHRTSFWPAVLPHKSGDFTTYISVFSSDADNLEIAPKTLCM